MNRKMAQLFDAIGRFPAGSVIVEIGCIRFSEEIPSDGWSTVHLARAATELGWRFHSVDIDAKAVRVARAATAGLSVSVHQEDGRDWLKFFAGPIDVLYLDGSADPAEALGQYRAARLSPHCLVAIDDVQPIGEQEQGKGDQLLDVLEADGFDVGIVDTEPGYRMGIAIR